MAGRPGRRGSRFARSHGVGEGGRGHRHHPGGRAPGHGPRAGSRRRHRVPVPDQEPAGPGMRVHRDREHRGRPGRRCPASRRSPGWRARGPAGCLARFEALPESPHSEAGQVGDAGHGELPLGTGRHGGIYPRRDLGGGSGRGMDAKNMPAMRISTRLVIRPTVRWRLSARGGGVVPLADPGQQEHLVVHRQARHHHQRQDRHRQFDRAGRDELRQPGQVHPLEGSTPAGDGDARSSRSP